MTAAQDINISIKLTVQQWNVILNILQKLPFEEPRGVMERFGTNTKDKKFEKLTDECEVTMSVNDFNIMLVCVKVLPFYDSFDIVNAIMVQGTEQMDKMSKDQEEKQTPKRKTARRKKTAE